MAQPQCPNFPSINPANGAKMGAKILALNLIKFCDLDGLLKKLLTDGCRYNDYKEKWHIYSQLLIRSLSDESRKLKFIKLSKVKQYQILKSAQ